MAASPAAPRLAFLSLSLSSYALDLARASATRAGVPAKVRVHFATIEIVTEFVTSSAMIPEAPC
jgi:hypothetical protein